MTSKWKLKCTSTCHTARQEVGASRHVPFCASAKLPFPRWSSQMPSPSGGPRPFSLRYKPPRSCQNDGPYTGAFVLSHFGAVRSLRSRQGGSFWRLCRRMCSPPPSQAPTRNARQSSGRLQACRWVAATSLHRHVGFFPTDAVPTCVLSSPQGPLSLDLGSTPIHYDLILTKSICENPVSKEGCILGLWWT